jgi:hypothetical protein
LDCFFCGTAVHGGFVDDLFAGLTDAQVRRGRTG